MDGIWLLRSFHEHMNCQREADQDVERWSYIAQLTSDEGAQQLPVTLESLQQVAGLLYEILMPFDTVDPVSALECPLGTA